MIRLVPISARATRGCRQKFSQHKASLQRYKQCEIRRIASVARLDSWKIKDFQRLALGPQIPSVLPRSSQYTPPACNKWFIHHTGVNVDTTAQQERSSELDPSFWSSYTQEVVPLEITRRSTNTATTTFERINAPLELLLSYLKSTVSETEHVHSIYLAQHDLRDLPASLQNDLPTPSLVLEAGKGDIYGSSLWLGRPPTYTPLHRDPNPNLFMQLAGTKVVRLFSPAIGNAIFEHAARILSSNDIERSGQPGMETGSALFRGEEMMQGSERAILHDLVWGASSSMNPNHMILQHAQDATLSQGDALFIPKHWWHSVKGIGNGVTASANWWFR